MSVRVTLPSAAQVTSRLRSAAQSVQCCIDRFQTSSCCRIIVIGSLHSETVLTAESRVNTIKQDLNGA